MFRRKMALLGKIESSYGVDAVPTGALNAILASDVTIETMQGGTSQRAADTPYLGGKLEHHNDPYTVLKFKVELAGSGAATTAPAYGFLLRACGFSQTIGGSSVIYAPISEGFESATLYYNNDGVRHRLFGVRGTVELELNPGGFPQMSFTLTGLRDAPSASAMPTVDTTGFKGPLTSSDSNTTTFSLFGYNPVMHELSFSMGNQVVKPTVVNDDQVRISDRAITGSCTIEEPAIGTKDYHALIAAHTTGALQWNHGLTAGGIVQIDAPRVQLLQPRGGDKEGITTLGMNLNLIPTAAGDDEFTLTTK